MVSRDGSVNMTQLREFFPEVSEVTLRKDLQYLDETHQLIRVHGGAKAFPDVANSDYRANINQVEKRFIATKAAKLLKPGSSVFITSGSTCMELARNLPNMPLCVFTDGLYTAINFPRREELVVRMIGGEVDMNTKCVEGMKALQALDELYFNIAFIGTMGFHPDYGFTYFSEMKAATNAKVSEKSDLVVMLMDSSKVNYMYMPNSLPLASVDIVVTDGLLESAIVKKMEANGIKVI